MDDNIAKLKKWVEESDNIVFFGGAGVSTESGIPDFRSTNGLYHQQWKYNPETILSHSFFEANPEEYYRFYRAKLMIKDVKPNITHLKLAELEKEGKMRAVVTQNIDGLHQAAGSKRVIELHGSLLRAYCSKCGKIFNYQAMNVEDGVPRCDCGGVIKPDVVLYEEGLDDSTVNGALNAIMQADTLIIAGTSLTVYPAAGFIRYFRGDTIVLINRDETPFDSQADLIYHDKVGELLGQLKVGG
jgi:NAD-dependent deacetylase